LRFRSKANPPNPKIAIVAGSGTAFIAIIPLKFVALLFEFNWNDMLIIPVFCVRPPNIVPGVKVPAKERYTALLLWLVMAPLVVTHVPKAALPNVHPIGLFTLSVFDDSHVKGGTTVKSPFCQLRYIPENAPVAGWGIVNVG